MKDAWISLEACLTLSIFWLFWHYGWKRFALDQFRQRLFSIRDTMFDLAANNFAGLTLESRAYVSFRQALNNRIRFAHRLSFHHIWLAVVFGRNEDFNSMKPQSTLDIEALTDPKLKERFEEFQGRAALALLEYMVLTSPAFIALILVSFICVLIPRVLNHSLKAALKLALKVVKQKEIAISVRAVDCQADVLGGIA